MKVGDEFIIPRHVRDVYGNKVGLAKVKVTHIQELTILVEDKATGSTIQLLKPVDMEERKNYFRPIEEGNWKGFTFWQYYKKNMLIPSIIGLTIAVIPLILKINLVVNDSETNAIIFTTIFGLLIFLVSFIGTIYTWGELRKRIEK